MLQSVKAWTLDERRELQRLYPRTADAELAALFGASVAAVRVEAERLALAKDKTVFRCKMPRWTSDQVARLRALYADHATLEVARLLGRTKRSVFAQARRLGLQKTELRMVIAGHENVRLRRSYPPRETG